MVKTKRHVDGPFRRQTTTFFYSSKGGWICGRRAGFETFVSSTVNPRPLYLLGDLPTVNPRLYLVGDLPTTPLSLVPWRSSLI